MSCKVYNSSFNPLFRFLEDFDNHYSHKQVQTPHRYVVTQATPQWQPKFDIRETEQAYEFFAELPGVSKEDVSIKFADHQTITIEGKTERSYDSSSAPESPVEEPTQAAATVDDSDKHSTSSYQATVEDDFEEISSDATTATVETERTERTEKVEPKEAEKPQSEEMKATPKAKYWLAERSFGQFSRSFQFPSPVDQDAVSANFKNGILAVIVPKAKKHEHRPIIIT